MFIEPTLVSLLALPLGILLFLLPGWLLATRCGSPCSILAAFLVSAALLLNVSLTLDALHIGLNRPTLFTSFAVCSVALLWRCKWTTLNTATGKKIPSIRIADWIWLPPVIAGLGTVAIRAIIDPLSGYDNGTRWDYLARLFLAKQSLAGYPPVTGKDFEYYSWCDGIPPLVPLLNTWIYATTGSIAPALTAARVIGEAILLGIAIARYAQLLWGTRAGLVAIALGTTSSLLLWSVTMGQETALMAIAVVGMLYFIECYRQDQRVATILWAGVSAGVAAVTREYGLAFAVSGFGTVAAIASLRRAAMFAVPVAIIATPWYLRNAWLTGNPIYPHTLGGFFPGNPTYDEVSTYVSNVWGLRQLQGNSGLLIAALAIGAGAVFCCGSIGLFITWRSRPWFLFTIALGVALWLASVSHTAGGWIYSTRVLAPTLALLAVAAGAVEQLSVRMRRVLSLGCTLMTAEAGRRAWLLPESPLAAPSWSLAEWQENHAAVAAIAADPLWNSLVHAANGRGIVVMHTADHALITMRNGRAVSVFSPLLAATLSPQVEFADAAETLRANGIRFFALPLQDAIWSRFVRAHPFWIELCQKHPPNYRVESLSIYDLDHLQH